MSKEITELDYALNCAAIEIDTTNARAELAALRARCERAEAELQKVTAERDALRDDIVCAFCGTHYRADAVPPEHWRTCESSPLVQRVAELEAQLATYQRWEEMRK